MTDLVFALGGPWGHADVVSAFRRTVSDVAVVVVWSPAARTSMIRDPASLRDPAGFVFFENRRVRRAVTEYGLPHVRAVRDTGLVDRFVAKGWLLPEEQIATQLNGYPNVRLVLEQPRLPFVSYPYEWPARALRAAALLHLDIRIEALDAGVSADY